MRRTSDDQYNTVRWVVQEHSAEFGHPSLTPQGFGAWYAGRYKREIFSEPEEAKVGGLGLVKEYALYKGLEWIDNPSSSQLVANLILTDRMGYASPEQASGELHDKLVRVAEAETWNKRCLRRQHLDEKEALKVARWVWKHRVDPTLSDYERLEYSNMRDRGDKRVIGRSPDDLAAYSAEVARLLESDSWHPFAYNEVARATQVDYNQALAALRFLATRPQPSVIALREVKRDIEKGGRVIARKGEMILADPTARAEDLRPTHFKWCPERAAMASGQRGGAIERLTYKAIKRDPGVGKRGLRAAVRDYLGGVRHETVDRAIDRLLAEGLIVSHGKGERSRARYEVAPLESADRLDRQKRISSSV